MIYYYGKLLVFLMLIYLMMIWYEKYEIPRRVEAARLRVIYECQEFTGRNCEKITPVIYKCE